MTTDTVDPADTIDARIARLEETIGIILGLVLDIRKDLGRMSAPVLFDAPDGTVAIRDPDIIAQQQRTGMRGYAPYVPPPQ